MILDIKYRGRTLMLRDLARMFIAAFENLDIDFDLIIPVPVHYLRRIARNLDHTFLLAEALGKIMPAPVSRELVRIRNTPPQSDLSRNKRTDNVRNAFRAKNRLILEGANILLVDDIATTIATANESARVLLDAGVSSVTLAIIARTERKGHFS
jgi:ComF family protein